MRCILRDPTPAEVEAARKARADAYNGGDEGAAESTMEEFLPLCWCPHCVGEEE